MSLLYEELLAHLVAVDAPLDGLLLLWTMAGKQIAPPANGIKHYAVWMAGFMVQGDGAPTKAMFLGSYEATNFFAACMQAIAAKGWNKTGLYDAKANTYRGCQLYDNETDARKSFG